MEGRSRKAESDGSHPEPTAEYASCFRCVRCRNKIERPGRVWPLYRAVSSVSKIET